MATVEYAFDEFLISTDPSKLDIPAIHRFLSIDSYWCKGIPFETVERSIRHSLNFGLYQGQDLIGFARVISDYATIAYLGDIYVLEAFRGRGLSKRLMEQVLAHPELQGLRRWMLLTASAHGLYEQFGFTPLANPANYLQLHNREVYNTHNA
jgi:GNAT superfamily N-acetyltransferase